MEREASIWHSTWVERQMTNFDIPGGVSDRKSTVISGGFHQPAKIPELPSFLNTATLDLQSFSGGGNAATESVAKFVQWSGLAGKSFELSGCLTDKHFDPRDGHTTPRLRLLDQ